MCTYVRRPHQNVTPFFAKAGYGPGTGSLEEKPGFLVNFGVLCTLLYLVSAKSEQTPESSTQEEHVHL